MQSVIGVRVCARVRSYLDDRACRVVRMSFVWAIFGGGWGWGGGACKMDNYIPHIRLEVWLYVCGYVGMYVKIVSEIWKRNSKCIKNHVILCKGIGNVSVLNIGY